MPAELGRHPVERARERVDGVEDELDLGLRDDDDPTVTAGRPDGRGSWTPGRRPWASEVRCRCSDGAAPPPLPPSSPPVRARDTSPRHDFYRTTRYRMIWRDVDYLFLDNFTTRGDCMFKRLSFSRDTLDKAGSHSKENLTLSWPATLTVTFPTVGHHSHLTDTNLYYLATEAHVCENLV